jgi:hypothetical protein
LFSKCCHAESSCYTRDWSNAERVPSYSRCADIDVIRCTGRSLGYHREGGAIGRYVAMSGCVRSLSASRHHLGTMVIHLTWIHFSLTNTLSTCFAVPISALLLLLLPHTLGCTLKVFFYFMLSGFRLVLFKFWAAQQSGRHAVLLTFHQYVKNFL